MRRFYHRLGQASSLVLPVAVLAIISSSSVLGAPPTQTGNVHFSLEPATHTLSTGQTVDVAIRFDATTDPVSAAQVYLDFDPNRLQVVDASGNPANTIDQGGVFSSSNWVVLQNEVANTAGTINFAGGKNTPTSQPTPSDINTLATFATFRFKAINSIGSTSISFSTSVPRKTKAVSGFSDVSGNLAGMTINVLNAAPTPSNDSATVSEGGTVTTLDSSFTSLLQNDTDPEGDSLTLSTTPLTPPANGNVTLNANGTFSYTHVGDETTTDSFVYEVCDTGLLCASATVNIAVTPVNDSPTAVDDDASTNPGFTTDEDTDFTTPNVLANDTDPDIPTQTLSVQSFDDSLTVGTVTSNGNGTFQYDPGGAFESLAAGQQAFDSFSYTVVDSGNPALTDTAIVTITINGADEAQTLTFTASLQGTGAPNSPSSWAIPVEVEIYAAGTNSLVTSGIFTASAPSGGNSGTFLVSGVLAGVYDVWVKVVNAVSSFHTGITVSASATEVDLGVQTGGDATGGVGGLPDNVVDSSDYSGLLAVFGSPTSELSPAQQRYDFNRDGTIDVQDYSIVVGNFGQVGAAKP